MVVRVQWATLIGADLLGLHIRQSTHAWWTRSPPPRLRASSSSRWLLWRPHTTSSDHFHLGCVRATQRWWSLLDGVDENHSLRHHALLSFVPSRRQWIQQTQLASKSLGYRWSSVVRLASSSAAVTVGVVSTDVTCDPSVSVWRHRDTNRLVYLLGTAHSSQHSARLAKQLVRDVRPGAVFIELDPKKVKTLPIGRVIQSLIKTSTLRGGGGGGGGEASDPSSSSSSVPPIPSSRLIVPVFTSALSPSLTAQSAAFGLPNDESNSFWSRCLDVYLRWDMFASTVRGAIAYLFMDPDLLKEGNEFVAATQEGCTYGADIVLGDQDSQVTFRRVIQASIVTGTDKISDLEQKMKLPSGGGEGASGGPMSKDDFLARVESKEAREHIRAMHAEQVEIAPAFMHVLVTERDAFMAAGLDSLNQYEVIVAVIGMSHQDGVERNLQNVGWEQVHPNLTAT